MDDLFAPCHFTRFLHDMSEEAIHELPLFVGGDSTAARKHLSRVTHIIIRYCLSSQYKHEDVKMLLFAFSLEGDALNWFHNCPKNSFAPLQDIINAFKDRYGDQGGSPCAPSTMQQDENDLVEDPTVKERFQDNSPYQKVPSTCTVARRIHDIGKTRTNCQINVDNERENDKHVIEELK